MGFFKKIFINKIAKKQAEKAVNDLISGLPPLTLEQQKDFERMLESNRNAPPTKFTHETLNIGDTVSKYDFNHILTIDEKRNNIKRYILENENQMVAQNDLENLLDLVKETINDNKISIEFDIQSKLNFSYKNYKKVIDFAFLQYDPFTKTGKGAKFPLKLNIRNKCNEFGGSEEDLINGEIYYLQSGEIGKSRLFIWHSNSCYTFYISIKDKNLRVTKIEKVTNINEYEKDIIYELDKY